MKAEGRERDDMYMYGEGSDVECISAFQKQVSGAKFAYCCKAKKLAVV